jgi:hypothetical protein
VLNFVLRLAWLHSFTHFGAIDPDQPTIDFFFACLEVVRRGHWNFYRYAFSFSPNKVAGFSIFKFTFRVQSRSKIGH